MQIRAGSGDVREQGENCLALRFFITKMQIMTLLLYFNFDGVVKSAN